MNKKDIAELKKRFSKRGCTFTKMCGCYVDGERNKITTFTETFLNLDEDEFYKYLEIAKKVLSGTLGNNMLELEFPLAQEALGGRQQFLLGVRDSALKQEELTERFFDMVIENYECVGNYLILVFHDAYDVMKKTKDNIEEDESEEVYEYLVCAICPVELSKPALGYQEEGNCIRALMRDWVVGMPDTGFVFPAFTDRSTDIHSALFYTRDAKHPHTEFVEGALGCKPRLTAAEKKVTFADLIKNTTDQEQEGEVFYMDIQGNLNEMVERSQQEYEEETVQEEAMVLTSQMFSQVLAESGCTQEQAKQIEKTYEELFGEDLPQASQLLEPKVVEANERRKDRLELLTQVEHLKQQLEEKMVGEIAAQVPAEREKEVHIRLMDGKRYLMIPMEEEEQAAINGRILEE